MDTLDSLDIGIVKLLETDGRMSNSEIARRQGVSEGAVRMRLKRLIEGRILRIQPMLNLERFGEWHLAVIGLNIEGRELEQCAAQLAAFPEVVTAMVVAGHFDLMLTLLLEDQKSLTDFITRKLGKVPGIRDSETFVCLKRTDPWVSAACLVRK